MMRLALEAMGLRKAGTILAQCLAESESASVRWVGKEALREFAQR